MYGLNPVPLKGARVLELGASCGGNIVPQALYYPETTFHGYRPIRRTGKTRQRYY